MDKRLCRDFGCSVEGLINVAKGSRKRSLEDLCASVCPEGLRADKTEAAGVRLGNWAAWPLSEAQVVLLPRQYYRMLTIISSLTLHATALRIYGCMSQLRYIPVPASGKLAA